MRSIEEVRRVVALVQQGMNDCEIARSTGIPRRTIQGWRHGQIPRFARTDAPTGCSACGHPRHDLTNLPTWAYTYLLGAYLGDGFIARHSRTHRLTIYMDRAYPGIVHECLRAMDLVVPSSKAGVYRRRRDRTDEIRSYSNHRSIRLTGWQRLLVETDPRPLLRGLIHTDGSRHLNTIRHPKKTYAYPRYEFTNLSDDIKRIFCWACDLLGIEWRRMNAKAISIARRESVAAMDVFIGPKR